LSLLLNHRLRPIRIVAKFLRGEPENGAVPVTVTRNLMTQADGVSNQFGEAFCDPSKEEKSAAYSSVGEQLEQALCVSFDA
jgi:hypothetical protein